MKNLKAAALVVVTALSANFAVFAAPDLNNTDISASVNVNMWSNTDTITSISANRLFDNSELTWLQYGFSKTTDSLRIKQVISDQNIQVNLTDSSLIGSENDLSLKFNVVSQGATFGVHPVIVVLENTKTGSTAAVGINVIVE